MAKEVVAIIKLHVAAGKANPAPPVGPALGQRGVNIMAFCKEFNAKTAEFEQGSPLPVVITVYKDKSFSFIFKKPTASFLLKKAASIQSAAKTPGREVCVSLTEDKIREVAEVKMDDMNCYDLEQAIKIVKGTARSMGISVE